MIRILVVCEAPADKTTGCELADRALVQAHGWLDGLLDNQRAWIGAEPGASLLLWSKVPTTYRSRGFPQFIAFGTHREPDAIATARALRIARDLDVDGVVLLRDLDDQPTRRAGMERARAKMGDTEVVIGAMCRMREAWVLNGFEPQDDEEEGRLAGERQNLGFDPRVAPERLTAKNELAKKSPKRVLAALTVEDWERQASCWRQTSLGLLCERGVGSGLSAYVEEVRARLALLIAPVPPC